MNQAVGLSAIGPAVIPPSALSPGLSAGSTIGKLLQLPQFDSTGKLNLGGWTDTRDDDIRLADHEGIIRTIPGELSTIVPSGVVPYQNARVVQNLLTYTEDFSNAAWVASNMTKTASTLTASAANGTALHAYTALAGDYVLSVELKRDAGTGNVQISADSGSYTTVPLTASYQRFSVQQTVAAGAKNAGIKIVTDTDSVSVRNAQLEYVEGQANQNPSEYQSAGVAIGAELNPDTGFDDPGGYTFDRGGATDWVVSGSQAVCTAADATDNMRTALLGNAANTRFIININIIAISGGSLQVKLVPITGAAISTAGIHTVILDAPNANSALQIAASSGTTCTIDDVSVKEGATGFAYYDTANGNTVASNVITEAVGSALATVPTMVHWPASTNILIHSRDISSWSDTGTPTEVQDQEGVDGSPNTAWTIGDNDVELFEYKQIDTVISDDSNTHILSFYIAKDNDEARFPEFQFALQNGTGQYIFTQVNTKTGAITNRTTVGTVSSSIESISDSYWRLILTVQNNGTGNTNAAAIIYPSITTTWGDVEVQAQGTCIVDFVQLELDQSFASPPILTVGASASRDVTGTRHPFAGYFNQSGGVCVCDCEKSAANPAFSGIVSIRENKSSLLYNDAAGTALISYDGTSTTSKGGFTTLNNKYRIAVKWFTSGDLQVGLKDIDGAGSWGWDVTPASYDGGFAEGAGYINLGYDNGYPLVFHKVDIYNKTMTTTQIEVLP